MNDKKRRKIMKSIGTLPLWTTPIVQTVVLPAHAQTSNTARLVDVTPPPPGFTFCELDSSGNIPKITAVIKNAGGAPLTINSISVTSDLGSSNWTADISLPISLGSRESVTIIFSSSPIFLCSSNSNPVLRTVYDTDAGSFTLTH